LLIIQLLISANTSSSCNQFVTLFYKKSFLFFEEKYQQQQGLQLSTGVYVNLQDNDLNCTDSIENITKCIAH